MKIKGLYQKRGWWYYQGPQRDGARPKPIALRTQNSAEAIALAFNLSHHIEVERVRDKNGIIGAVKAYTKSKLESETHTLKTSYHTEKNLLTIFKELGDPNPPEVTEKMLKTWSNALRLRDGHKGRKISPSTVDTYLRQLRSFFTWCVDTNRITVHPMRGIKQSRIKRTRRQDFCSIADRDKLLENPPSEELDFILNVGFFAGLRIGEMLAMEPHWIFLAADGSHGSITVQRTAHWQPKDKELRTIPMNSRLIEFFQRYGIRRPFMLAPRKPWKDAPKMRFNPKKQLATHVQKCAVKTSVTYHTLRHSFATHLAMQGAQMVEIATLLGDDLSVVEANYVGFSSVNRNVVGRL